MQSQKNIFKNDRGEERFFFRATAAFLNYFEQQIGLVPGDFVVGSNSLFGIFYKLKFYSNFQ